jgi:hypothetical protein
MSEKQNNEWAKRDIGALWKKEGKSQKFLSGYIKDETGMQTEVVIFANKYKQDNPKAPDYRIYLSTKTEPATKSEVKAVAKNTVKPSVKKVVEVAQEEEDLL